MGQEIYATVHARPGEEYSTSHLVIPQLGFSSLRIEPKTVLQFLEKANVTEAGILLKDALCGRPPFGEHVKIEGQTTLQAFQHLTAAEQAANIRHANVMISFLCRSEWDESQRMDPNRLQRILTWSGFAVNNHHPDSRGLRSLVQDIRHSQTEWCRKQPETCATQFLDLQQEHQLNAVLARMNISLAHVKSYIHEHGLRQGACR